jgi:hypothetical protein
VIMFIGTTSRYGLKSLYFINCSCSNFGIRYLDVLAMLRWHVCFAFMKSTLFSDNVEGLYSYNHEGIFRTMKDRDH